MKNALSKLASSSLPVFFLVTFSVASVFASRIVLLIKVDPAVTISAKSAGQNGKPITGVPGTADRLALINFTDLPRKESPSTQLQNVPEPESEVEDKPLPADAFVQRETSPASPSAPPSSPSPPPSTSFPAVSDNNSYIPPDTQGAVGPNQLMVTLNSQIAVQNRAGATLSTSSLNSFWASLGYTSMFDPRVLYDRFSNRWIFISLADYRTATSALAVSVSQTGDPGGAWRLYGFDIDSSNQNFADYPIFGFNKDWIVVTVNIYRISDRAFVTSRIYVFNKANLYAGGSGAFTLLQDASGQSMAPSVSYDNSISTVYLVENWNGNLSGSGYIRVSSITGPVGSEVLNSGIAFPSTANTWANAAPGDGNFAPQFGSSQLINNGDAVMQNVVYRNGSLWCAQTIFLPAAAPTRSAVQWWQLSTAGAIVQRGRIDDSTGATFYAYPAISVNQNNDALIGYSRFSSSQYASANYSFRGAGDPANTLRDEVVLKAGEAPYFKTSGSTRNKWGDLSNTVVDPVNDTDLWTIQEYAATPVGGIDRWGTWWGRVIPSGTPPSSGDIVLYASEAPVKVGNWTVVTDSTAAGGARLANSDQGAPKIPTPLANPTSYFEMSFNAQAATAYRLWMRGRAQGDSPYNDSVYVQFSGSVDAGGAAVYRTGTTSGTTVNLEDDLGVGLSGWGWQDNGWGVGVLGPLIYFGSTGSQTIRVQVREDGLSIDQIVLSPSTYLNSAPGSLRNDNTILAKQGGGASGPSVSGVSPNTGSTAGGTPITISGANFNAGAAASFGGVSANNVNVINSSTITAITPAHAAGSVNVTVTNTDGRAGTLNNGFTYVTSTPMPQFGHVFIVVEENHSYSSVIGSSSLPYLNNLANRYGLATNYYANAHPSIGNYFMLTTGQLITNDSNFNGTVTVDNIVRELTLAGKTWKSYAEGLPSVGYTGGDVYPYVKRHNPFAYFSDVIGTSQANNLVPFSQLATDLANNQLRNYSFIIPNQQHNGHDCPPAIPNCTDADKLVALDSWLSTNIQPLLASQAFQQDGLLILTFDESIDTDTANGGGQVATIVISSRSKPGFRSNTFYQHQNVLRTLNEALGLSTFPGAASGALNVSEFIETSSPVVSTITPNNGSISGGTSVTINGSRFSAGAIVSFGGSAATNINVVNSTTITATTPTHAAGAVNVTVTNGGGGQSGTLSNGFTYTSSPPPASTIVLYASEAPVRVGNWIPVADPTAAGGFRLRNPDAGVPKLVDPLSNPTIYFEMTFNAQAGTAYRLWIRGKAENDFWGNDSVFVQFSDSVSGSAPIFRIGTTSATTINLEDCSGCGLSGWGWQDNGWGIGVMGPLIFFANSGTHTLRIQVREDGLSIDQVVLSPNTYLNASPGALRNDNTILPKQQ